MGSLVCGIALLASACGSSPVNLPDPTPTTVMGVVATAEQPTDVPTQIPTQVPTEIPTEVPTETGVLLDVCSLITATEAEVVLGQSVTAITPGTDSDNISGETINFCTYLGKDLAVVISSVDTDSAEAARDMMKKQLDKMQSDDASTTSKEESGLGDQTYWSVAEHAVAFTVVKGSHAFSVTLGGNIGDAASHKAPLLILAKSVEGKF